MIMKTAVELGDILYLPYRVQTIELGQGDEITYICQSLIKTKYKDGSTVFFTEENLSKAKTYIEPFDSEKFSV